MTKADERKVALIDYESLAVKVLEALAGDEPTVTPVTANWMTGTAPSGATGAELMKFGTAGERHVVTNLDVDLSTLTAGSIVTIRMYKTVDGAERRFYWQPVTVPDVTDPNSSGLEDVNVINSLYIDGEVRVEVMSDTDDAKEIKSSYILG